METRAEREKRVIFVSVRKTTGEIDGNTGGRCRRGLDFVCVWRRIPKELDNRRRWKWDRRRLWCKERCRGDYSECRGVQQRRTPISGVDWWAEIDVWATWLGSL
ncbi:hypothetical protein M0R45_035881 [Rubus argutus]|uniref:Uncharacterized protein n=1 Tax=Rubus argutus TaxID=59490 RepID=A0AAW1VYZ6_RUBAR